MVYAMNMRGHWLWICVRFSFNNKKCVAGAEQTECQHQMRSGRRDVGGWAYGWAWLEGPAEVHPCGRCTCQWARHMATVSVSFRFACLRLVHCLPCQTLSFIQSRAPREPLMQGCTAAGMQEDCSWSPGFAYCN